MLKVTAETRASRRTTRGVRIALSLSPHLGEPEPPPTPATSSRETTMCRSTLSIAVLLLLLGAVARRVDALYSSNSAVEQLDASSFRKATKRGSGVTLVEFYAPWCGHCRQLAPEYEKAARQLQGAVTVAAVDATEEKNQRLAAQHDVQGFPTIKIFVDGADPVPYEGARTAEALVGAGMQALNKMVRDRQSGGGGSSSSSGGGSGSGSGGGRRRASSSGGSDVVEVTTDSFEEEVIKSEEPVLVEFYAPWCGHCKNLKGEWEQAATQLKGAVKVVAIDATAETQLASKYEIKGYPTIKYFVPGKKRPRDYQGAREAGAIVQFGADLAAKYGKPPEVPQLVSPAVMEESCKGNKHTCVIGVLPDLLDSGKDGRNEYIKLLQGVAMKMRGKPFKFLWAAGGDHSTFEDKLDLHFGFPALVAVSLDKQAYGVHRAAFAEKDMVDFLNKLAIGRASTSALPDDLGVATVDPWDGEEAPPMEEEEFSLDELFDEDEL